MTEIDVWLKKILAVEKHHPDVAIKYYNKIEQECKQYSKKYQKKVIIFTATTLKQKFRKILKKFLMLPLLPENQKLTEQIRSI